MVITAGGGRRGTSPVATTKKEFMDTIDTILLLALSLNLIYLARHCTTLRGWALRLHSPPTDIIRAFAKRKIPPKPIAHNMMGNTRHLGKHGEMSRSSPYINLFNSSTSLNTVVDDTACDGGVWPNSANIFLALDMASD